MSNLLEETKGAITSAGRTPDEIIFIGSEHTGHSCTWVEFCALADFHYDDGYGGQEIADDLIIVFEGGAKLARGEYDGSEWWEYDAPFKMPTESKPIHQLKGGRSLEDLNR